MTQGFSVSVDLDYSPVLQGLKKVEQAAQTAGQAAGKALGDGIEGVASKSIDALLADLGRLKAQRNQIQIDGGQVTALNQQISAVQKQIDTLRAARVAVQADPKSIDAFNQKLGDLRNELNKVAIGSDRFRELQAQISATERELIKAGQGASGLRALDGVIQGVAFSLTNTLTNAAITAIQSISQIAGEVRKFDSAKAAVRTLGVDADDLGDRLLKLSASTKGNVSAVDLLKASYYVASSGFASAADATNILAAAQNGAVGGFTDINTVADATTSVLNAYGLSSDKAGKLIDGFIQTQNDGKIVVGQYAQEIGRIAPVAAASGVSIDELNAAISAATAQGVPVGSTFAGLRQAISSILKPSAEASQYAASLGINFSASELKAKGFGGLMKEIAEKTGGSAEAIIRLTGSVEAQAAIQPLVNDGLVKYNQFLKNQAGAAGVAADAADKATATVDGSLKRLANTLSNLGVQAFQGIAPVVSTLINAVNNSLIALLGLPAPVKAVAGALAGLTTAYVSARTAAALFNAVLATQQVQGIIKFFVDIGLAIKQDFQKSLTLARSEWLAFTASVQSQGLVSSIGGIGKAFLAMAGQVAALAVRFAYIAAAVEAYQKITGAADEASQGFSDRLLTTQKALDAVSTSTNKASAASSDLAKNSNGVINFFEKLPILLRVVAAPLEGVIRLFYSAIDNFSKANALNTISNQSAQLQAKFTEVQQAAQKTFVELKNATSLTPDQAKSVQERISSLQAIKDAALGQAKAYQELAASYRAAGKNDLAQIAEKNAKIMTVEANVSDRLIVLLQGVANKTNDATNAKKNATATTEQQIKAVQAQAKAEEELNKIISRAPLRNLDNQLAVGQQLLSLTKAVGDLEQSRFNVTRSRLQYELKALEDRDAGESAIKAKKDEIDKLDRVSLQSRYQFLKQQQGLELAILGINQQKARLEAQLESKKAAVDLLKAEKELKQAISGGDKFAIDAANAQYKLQKQILVISDEKLGLLRKTQPLETATLKTQTQIAQNGLKAEAAARDFMIASDGSLKKVNSISGELANVVILSKKAGDNQRFFKQLAESSGLAIGRASDGSLLLGRRQDNVKNATKALNFELDATKKGYEQTTSRAQTTQSVTEKIRNALRNSGIDGITVAGIMRDIGNKANTAKDKTEGFNDKLNKGRGSAYSIASSFVSVGRSAPTAVQGARDFAGWLSGAKTFAEKINGINRASKMNTVADATKRAANEAARFYDWLFKASGLPGSRWTGGPVEAGGEYRVNELGQEALLSAGRLSLISAPQNAIWRAPASGVVIPAGITARLREAGALPTAGGGSVTGVADLAVEVGKLRQEVAELTRKDWSIHVQQRTGPTASQVMNQLHRLR